MKEYDMIIVGAGIAGLRVALETKKKNSKSKILIIEKYEKAGGRIQTIHTEVNNKKIQYESGAGRISIHHKKLLKLINEYNLTIAPISKEISWRSYGSKESEINTFETFWLAICEQLDELSTEIKRKKTLRDLAIEIFGVEFAKSLLDKYPYRAEIEVSSAESAIDLYKSIGTSNFYILKEGFSALIEKMLHDIKKHNIEIQYEHTVNRVNIKNGKYIVLSEKNSKYQEHIASRVVLAVHRNALQSIYPFSSEHPLVKAVTMEPLLRIYSVYKDSSWFPSTRVVTNSPLRNIIPINKSTGLIMSSYLDARDIDLWTDLYKKGKSHELKDKIHNDTTALFPELDIKEKPIEVYAEFWRDGCSYWNTNTNYKNLSQEALQPYPIIYPNLHIVGESFSKKPQWIEGALEHADELISFIKHLDTEKI